MSEELLSENIQDVAAPETEGQDATSENQAETGGNDAGDAGQQKPENVQDERELSKTRDFERDAAFARMRRDAQAAKAEAERVKKEAERLKQAVSLYGFQGRTADEIADALEAQKRGISVDALRMEKLQKQAELQKALESSPMKKQLEAENQQLKKTLSERIYKEDMETIQKAYPECAAKSVFELGDDFVRLRAAGVSPIVAYEAVHGAKMKTTKPAPPSTGSVKSSAPAGRDYFTPDEVDRLTSRQLDDPNVMDKVLKSMAKWKK